MIHPVGGLLYPSTASHNYGNPAGTFSILLRVFGVNQPGDGSHNCGTTVKFDPGCTGTGATACKLSPMDALHHITATVSYATGSNTASIDWGDSSSTPLPSGTHVNLVVTHHYASNSTFVVHLDIKTAVNGTLIARCSLTTSNTPSAVTISSMHAESVDGGMNWAAIAFGLLGVVVLGQLAVFAVLKRK